MKKMLHWLDVHFEDALCGALLVGIMIMLMAQVVVRFLFGHGLTASEELCRFSFLYMVYFAASLVACKGAHIRVTAHTRHLPRPLRVGLLVLADLCWLGFNATVIYQGVLLLHSMAARPMVSGSLLLDLRYVYVAVPAAFLLQSFRILQRWARHFRGRLSILGDEAAEADAMKEV